MTTPAGTPAISEMDAFEYVVMTMMMMLNVEENENTQIQTSARVVDGVSSAGFTTQVHPAARAAATCKSNSTNTDMRNTHCVYKYKYKSTMKHTQVHPEARAAATS